jgi:hypothetical protein
VRVDYRNYRQVTGEGKRLVNRGDEVGQGDRYHNVEEEGRGGDQVDDKL